MSESREELEQQLIKNPFDNELRTRYAQTLQREESWEAALEQWQLLLRQSRESAEPFLEAAICCVRSSDLSTAKEYLQAARGCADFDAKDPRLESLPEDEQPGRLRIMQGGRDDGPRAEVVSISSTPKTRFSDIVGMESLKKVLRLRIIEPFVNPGLFQRFKKNSGGGVMLYGPPGCGKTMMARAIAAECNASFTPVGISDILNMWIGESERNLAAIFAKDREESPAVLFFDEIDALAFSRSKATSDHTRTLVNEFLAQLDGMAGDNEKVLVLAATNMPWDVDDAMKRPGRFDRQVFVPPPDEAAVSEMFRLKLIDVPTDELNWPALGKAASRFSGADVDGAIERAKDRVLGEILDSGEERSMSQQDLLDAIDEGEPTTIEWLKTARNLVKFGGGGRSYREVEKYLRSAKLY